MNAQTDLTPSPRVRPAVRIAIRTVRPEDRPALRALYESLSQPARHARFLGLVHASEGNLARFCDPCHALSGGFVACVAADDAPRSIVGHICMDLDQVPAACEVAMVVADDWQGKGIGRALLCEAVRWAAERKIRRLFATTLAGNAPARCLLEDAGWALGGVDEGAGLMRYVVDLSAGSPSRA